MIDKGSHSKITKPLLAITLFLPQGVYVYVELYVIVLQQVMWLTGR